MTSLARKILFLHLDVRMLRYSVDIEFDVHSDQRAVSDRLISLNATLRVLVPRPRFSPQSAPIGRTHGRIKRVRWKLRTQH